MIVFVAYTANYWGKGKTLTEALQNLKKAEGKKQKKVAIAIYEAKDFDDIWVTDLSEIHRGLEDELLYNKLETI